MFGGMVLWVSVSGLYLQHGGAGEGHGRPAQWTERGGAGD
jgi:hypothetical protein